ncbi:MAG: tRNA uridine-5-carboxymethylaminomethyl(34) synthesis enzyme MnmG [Phycisphaerales bacterium]|nr:tRNA uridine-5-carboxymethylaminomethyl(34) synthesis enzyme MnmG [Phycisphaerales bacterium]
MDQRRYSVIVIGGGHAGAEAAWAAANLLGGTGLQTGVIALVTIDPAKIGVMSCNPAIGGLAKGQLVREIDALGGLMGLAADATGIQFKVLNSSRGAAVRGPRAQCDKHAYAEAVRRMVGARPEIDIITGTVERLLVEDARILGVRLGDGTVLAAPAVVLTTGTFMRGLMHTGESKTPGGRHGEAAATGISAALTELGFELGRLKTGTPPRLARGSLRWDDLDPALGDDPPTPFSDLSLGRSALRADGSKCRLGEPTYAFPALPQVDCRQTATTAAVHDLIRANLHRAPMYSGQIESVGPRYCPSIEDKVVRFAERGSHTVFLEPESLRDDWVYCNGISTSLPADVQDAIVHALPGCERAVIHRYGYAVEYDMVRPHQIHATGMTKRVDGLFLAGQINGTSGYEEAAAQGLVAGVNAARYALGQPPWTLGRHEAYIGVLMDDLVTRTPTEPYRMFTSRAEHRLSLRADNAADRLTPIAETLGLLAGTELGRLRSRRFTRRRGQMGALHGEVDAARVGGVPMEKALRQPGFDVPAFQRALGGNPARYDETVWFSVHADRAYAAYVVRQHAEVRRSAELERRRIPARVDYARFAALRAETRQALSRFRPETFGQAGRLEGVTPADLTLLSVLLSRPGAVA